MSIIFQIFKLQLPMRMLVQETIDSRAELEKTYESVKTNLSPLALAEPEYSDVFRAWCYYHGDSSAEYEMCLTDSKTNEIYTSKFRVPERPSIETKSFSRSDSLASSINSISGSTTNADLLGDPSS